MTRARGGQHSPAWLARRQKALAALTGLPMPSEDKSRARPSPGRPPTGLRALAAAIWASSPSSQARVLDLLAECVDGEAEGAVGARERRAKLTLADALGVAADEAASGRPDRARRILKAARRGDRQ